VYLRQLLDAYWQGLSWPLSFFPETSLAWAEAMHAGKDGLRAARQSWEDGFNRDGEGRNSAYKYFFQQDTFTPSEEFIVLADLFTLIFAHLEDDHAAT
jgi:exodeoxyribonuclease V gamma subunit